ncbi:MAG: hypothetical protein ACXWZ4_11035 [Gemmatirosa sp.]
MQQRIHGSATSVPDRTSPTSPLLGADEPWRPTVTYRVGGGGVGS